MSSLLPPMSSASKVCHEYVIGYVIEYVISMSLA
jgi:hypothetical protein